MPAASQVPTGTLILAPDCFLASLTWEELRLLRTHVKRVHMAEWPPETRTDREADRLIESFGPAAKEQIIKRVVDAKWRT
jgi:hypothetical protein